MLTGKQIEGDIFRIVKQSDLATVINGGVYREGTRPEGSRKEDIEIIFTRGTNGQISEGVVTLNLFYPDIDPYGNGTFVEDVGRAEELLEAVADFADSLIPDKYLLEVYDTPATMAEPETNRHFIYLHLNYRHYGN